MGRSAAAVMAVLGLAGCVEPKLVVDARGPITSASADEKSSFGLFRSRYNELVADPSSPQKAYAVVEAGTQLEYQLCSTFFATAGRQQQVLLFSKDLIAFVATTASGVLGAARVSPSAIAWIGLGGAGAVTGINTYARNFLFSEDNVDAVQDLTLRALGAARDAALAPERSGSYTFSSAISTIMDVQSVCEVQHILNLSRDAIKNGAIAVSTGRALDVSIAATYEVTLGRITKGGVQLTANEFTALYWLFRSSHPPSTADEKKKAAASLSELTPPPLLATGDTNAGFKQAVQVSNILATIPSSLASVLEAAIQPGASSGAARSVAPPGAPDNVSSGRPPGRISVRIVPLQ